MAVVCFCSQKDIAAQTIKNRLLTLFAFTQTEHLFDSTPIYQLENLSLVTIESDSIHADSLDQKLKADLFIFASRHKSAAFKPALLTHVPGNWAKAELGGRPTTLCYAPPSAIKTALLTLHTKREELDLHDWAYGLEVTHHGPYIERTPSMFIEIGSTEKEWRNQRAAEAIAHTIVTVAQRYQDPYPTVLGFGGPHYCPAFTRLMLETNFTVSHIMPKYNLAHLTKSLLCHAIERTAGPVAYAALDWKGLKSSQRQHLQSLLKEEEIEPRRVRTLLHAEQERDS